MKQLTHSQVTEKIITFIQGLVWEPYVFKRFYDGEDGDADLTDQLSNIFPPAFASKVPICTLLKLSFSCWAGDLRCQRGRKLKHFRKLIFPTQEHFGDDDKGDVADDDDDGEEEDDGDGARW